MTSPCFRGPACCRVSPVCTTAAVVHGLWRDNHLKKKNNYPSSNESLYIIATRQHQCVILRTYDDVVVYVIGKSEIRPVYGIQGYEAFWSQIPRSTGI